MSLCTNFLNLKYKDSRFLYRRCCVSDVEKTFSYYNFDIQNEGDLHVNSC